MRRCTYLLTCANMIGSESARPGNHTEVGASHPPGLGLPWTGSPLQGHVGHVDRYVYLLSHPRELWEEHDHLSRRCGRGSRGGLLVRAFGDRGGFPRARALLLRLGFLSRLRVCVLALIDRRRGYTQTFTHICIHRHKYAYVHTCTHTYTHTYMHTYLHTYTHTYIHAYIHTCMHTYIHTCTHTYMHINLHTYLHT